jgi:hypothetical protein
MSLCLQEIILREDGGSAFCNLRLHHEGVHGISGERRHVFIQEHVPDLWGLNRSIGPGQTLQTHKPVALCFCGKPYLDPIHVDVREARCY